MTDDAKLDGSQEVRGVNLTPELEDQGLWVALQPVGQDVARGDAEGGSGGGQGRHSYVTEAVETAFGGDVSDVFCDLYHLDM